MNHNLLPSDRAAIVGKINPASHAAGNVSSDWISMVGFANLMAVVQAGALGSSATLDAKLEQATDAAGTGVKNITGKAITQLTQAGTDSNKLAVINCRYSDIDFAGGYTHVRLTMTVATADSIAAAVVYGLDARQGVASSADIAAVDEIV